MGSDRTGRTAKRKADYSPVQSLINAAEALPFGFAVIGPSDETVIHRDHFEDRGRSAREDKASAEDKKTHPDGNETAEEESRAEEQRKAAAGSSREGRILAVNQQFCDLCECRNKEELFAYTGGRYERLVNPDDLRAVQSRFREEEKLADEALRADTVRKERTDPEQNTSGGRSGRIYFGKPRHNFFRLRTKNGHEVHLEDTGSTVIDPIYGRVYILYVTVFGESRNQNVFDLVTGLYQKEYLNHWLREQYIYNPEIFHDRQLAVVYLNCRDFRIFNETFGYEAGNRLLKRMGEKIEEALCSTLACRVYADQFVVYCDAVHVENGIREVHEWAEKLYSDFQLWVSAGVYYIQGMDQKLETIADYAKIACDRIPAGSKEYFNIYSDELAKKLEKREYIQTHIDEAMEKGWLVLYLQPVVRTLSGKVCSAEGLTRWIDPKYGMISPGEFVSALEEKNLSYKLALFVIDAAAKLIRDGQTANVPVFPISINFSRKDFDVIDPYEEVEKAVQQYGISRSFLAIEITESMAMEDPVKIQSVIGRFHRAGYEVWMDDFGSAYSSLNTLKNFDFDEIKLDMVFMRGLNDKAREIVASCVNMAKHLGIHTLCEGVETGEQLEFLRDIGCERIQGFYYSKPRPPKELCEYMMESGLEVENSAERYLFDSIRGLIFDKETSWMLSLNGEENRKLRRKGDIGHIVYLSPKLRNEAAELDLDNAFIRNQGAKRPADSEFAQRVRTVIGEAERSGQEEELSYFYNGHYYALTSRVLAHFNGIYLSKTVVRDTTQESKQLLLANADPVTQSLVNLYDSIYRVNVNDMRMEVIASIFPGERAGAVFTYNSKQAAQFFWPKDRDRFLAWTKELKEKGEAHRSAPERVQRFATGAFRIRHQNGGYSWEAITVVPYENAAEGEYLICLKPSVFNDEKSARETAEAVLEEADGAED